MKRVGVRSSMINSIGYDEPRAVLEVEFEDGEVYDYFDVPLSVYEALRRADSVGGYFNEAIRDQYEFKKVG